MGDAVDALGALIIGDERVRYLRFSKRMTRKGRMCLYGVEGHVYHVERSGRYVWWIPDDESLRPAPGHGVGNSWIAKPCNLAVIAEKVARPPEYMVRWER